MQGCDAAGECVRPEPAREPIDLLDTYRLLSGATVDLSGTGPSARLYLLDLALRLAQGDRKSTRLNSSHT